jgi:hypothetical protein
MNRMTWNERLCMCLCFAIVGLLFWMVTHPYEFTAAVWGVFP